MPVITEEKVDEIIVKFDHSP